MTLYVIAGLYALIAAVWGAYAQVANEGQRPLAAFFIGLLWPVTVPLACYIAWRIGREIKDMDRRLQEAQREREERLGGVNSGDMIKALWSEEIVKGANQARMEFNVSMGGYTPQYEIRDETTWHETNEDEDWDDFWKS